MDQENKIKIEEASVNLGYLKKEYENEERINAESLIGFLDGDAIMKTESVKLEEVKEENNDLIQETIEQYQLDIIQCHYCKACFEQWEHLQDHILHCPDENYIRLRDNKLDIQRKSADEREETRGNGEISTLIDNNRSCLTLTETIDSKNFHILNPYSNTSKKDGPFECDICKKIFNRKYRLNRHIMNLHINEKQYKCTQCSYQTNYKLSLKRHLSKPFECYICKNKFTERGSLKRHVITHYNSKPFECDVCKMRFSQKSSLKTHIMNIHSNTNEKKHKCSECSYQTDHKSNLKRHLNTHYNIKPFECDICKMRFIQKSNLKVHIMNIHLHTNEKKHKCSK